MRSDVGLVYEALLARVSGGDLVAEGDTLTFRWHGTFSLVYLFRDLGYELIDLPPWRDFGLVARYRSFVVASDTMLDLPLMATQVPIGYRVASTMNVYQSHDRFRLSFHRSYSGSS